MTPARKSKAEESDHSERNDEREEGASAPTASESSPVAPMTPKNSSTKKRKAKELGAEDDDDIGKELISATEASTPPTKGDDFDDLEWPCDEELCKSADVAEAKSRTESPTKVTIEIEKADTSAPAEATVTKMKATNKKLARGRSKRIRATADAGGRKFTRGKHRGRTFRQVAKEDPSYHLRCEYKGYSNEDLARYRRYFDQHGDSNAARSHLNGHITSANLGNERFTSGRHMGQTFRQVADEDPSYHLRCAETGYRPGGMERYCEYFEQYGDQEAAARGERYAVGLALGINW